MMSCCAAWLARRFRAPGSGKPLTPPEEHHVPNNPQHPGDDRLRGRFAAVVMNRHPVICPARVSGVRNRCHGFWMALPAPSLRVALVDEPIVLGDLRSQDRDAHDDDHHLVLAGVHDRLLDVVFCLQRRVARLDGARAVLALLMPLAA